MNAQRPALVQETGRFDRREGRASRLDPWSGLGVFFAGLFVAVLVLCVLWMGFMMAQMKTTIGMLEKRIDEVSDDSKLVDLKVQNLQRDYAVLTDGRERKGETP